MYCIPIVEMRQPLGGDVDFIFLQLIVLHHNVPAHYVELHEPSTHVCPNLSNTHS
jgi:hypothetical protein